MSINTYEKDSKDIPSLIPLGIAMDYRVRWNMHRILRDFVQNFYDSIGMEHFADEFQYEWEIVEGDRICGHGLQEGRQLCIKMRTLGHSFSYEWLHFIGGSTKTGKEGYAGEYGEGFKIALLCLVKLGGDAVMSSGGWELRPCEYAEKIDGREIPMFGYRMKKRKDDGFTTLELYGIPASDENIRYVKEILLEFFYPGNRLLAQKIEAGDGYELYARSAVRIPCAEDADIQGVFYYKYIARGRLPFSIVIHLSEKQRHMDNDRSRDILTEAAVVGAVYKIAERLSPEASFWMLTQMREKWQDFPVFERDRPADLRTWYYVVCQLVRNIITEPELVKRFAQEYPPERFAYIERPGGDNGRNRLLREARGWFEQEDRGKNRRRLINPVFRLLGVSAVLQEYQEQKGVMYRKLNGAEVEREKLLRGCAKLILSGLDSKLSPPGILIRTERRRKKIQSYLQYGLLPYAETRAVRVFSGNRKKRHIKYQISEVVMDEEDLSAEADFQQVLLKYLGACVHVYGTERSERPNAALTYVGTLLYCFRDAVEEYEERWKGKT